MKKRFLLIFPLLLTSCSNDKESTYPQNSSSGEEDPSYSQISNNGYYFGTTMSVTLFGSSTEVLNHVFDIFSEYDALTDAYYSKVDYNNQRINNIYFLNKNQNDGVEVEVDPRLASLLSFGLEMQEKTALTKENGEKVYFFNPLIGEISSAWKNFIEEPTVACPSEELINQYLEDIKTSSLEVNGNKVKRTGKAKIDVGAYAKGYVIKKVQDYLKEEGVSSYFINGGSSSYGLGSFPNNKSYKITISSLTNYGYSQAYFNADNTSIATSGISQQSKKYDGKTYTHIIDPNTGSALATNDTVTIKAPDAGISDILSTAIFLGGEELAKFLKKTLSFEYMIFDGENVVSSDGLGLVLKK